MISRMNPRYSERIYVTNHNAKWRNCTYTVPLQMVITQEITRSKVIGQPINPFIGIAEDFVCFIGRYSDYFTVSTRSVATQAEHYFCGLMQSDKRNMEQMAEVVPDSDEQSFQKLNIKLSMERAYNFESGRYSKRIRFLAAIRTPV